MMKYNSLQAGETLKEGDQYYNGTVWKDIPAFMIRDKVKNNDAWRRPENNDSKPSEYWIVSYFKHMFKGFCDKK